MTDPRLAWFAIGASCSAVVFGWPWRPRFSRFNRRMGPPRGSYDLPPNHSWRDVPGRVQRGNNSGGPTTPKSAIVPKPEFPSPRKIPEDLI